MARKRYKPEEIVAKLRQVDVLVSQGQGMTEAIRQIGVSEVTYYRWRQEFGGLKTEQVKRLKDLELENSRLRKAVSDAGQAHSAGGFPGKLLSPARRRACIEQVRAQLHVSERRACAALGQQRSTQRKVPRGREDEERLTADIIELAQQYGRYGYRKVAGLLRQAGWIINDKRVERIWRREGLKVPNKQPKRGRLWLADGSCIRLRPQHRNHVWSYDFVEDRTHDGRRYRMLNVIDEFTHECLAIRVARKLNAIDVIDVLSDLFILRGVPGHIRSDNGPEFVAEAVQAWITAVGAKTAYIERASPWENGYVESFNARLRDELAQRRDLQHPPRSSDHHRKLAAPLQYDQAACLARLQATCTRGVPARLRRVAGCATPTGSASHTGATANLKLTFPLDHSAGADHGADGRWP
jgi:putative transposase